MIGRLRSSKSDGVHQQRTETTLGNDRSSSRSDTSLSEKLRALRREKNLTLQQVADTAGLSKAFVSQIESGTANPSLVSLKRVAEALGTPLAALFESQPNGSVSHAEVSPPETGDGGEVRVVRKDRRKRLLFPGRMTPSSLLTPDLQGKLEVVLDVLEPGDSSSNEDEHGMTHDGEEFGLILQGRYEVTVGGRTFLLEEGDSITYPSRIPHRGRAVGDQGATTLWVITPPSF
jgi:transcriptional regulator with XRE-family HTH domain/quercetin dioxygenase-like cupin family protein